MSKEYTPEEIKKHNTKDDCWIVIDNKVRCGLLLLAKIAASIHLTQSSAPSLLKVYDITNFLADHPGGSKAPMIYAGDDATEEFMMLHKPDIITKQGL